MLKSLRSNEVKVKVTIEDIGFPSDLITKETVKLTEKVFSSLTRLHVIPFKSFARY